MKVEEKSQGEDREFFFGPLSNEPTPTDLILNKKKTSKAYVLSYYSRFPIFSPTDKIFAPYKMRNFTGPNPLYPLGVRQH